MLIIALPTMMHLKYAADTSMCILHNIVLLEETFKRKIVSNLLMVPFE